MSPQVDRNNNVLLIEDRGYVQEYLSDYIGILLIIVFYFLLTISAPLLNLLVAIGSYVMIALSMMAEHSGTGSEDFQGNLVCWIYLGVYSSIQLPCIYLIYSIFFRLYFLEESEFNYKRGFVVCIVVKTLSLTCALLIYLLGDTFHQGNLRECSIKNLSYVIFDAVNAILWFIIIAMNFRPTTPTRTRDNIMMAEIQHLVY